jgi:hypothetical protein
MASASVFPSGEAAFLLLERLSHAYRKLEISSRAQLDKALMTPARSPTPASA